MGRLYDFDICWSGYRNLPLTHQALFRGLELGVYLLALSLVADRFRWGGAPLDALYHVAGVVCYGLPSLLRGRYRFCCPAISEGTQHTWAGPGSIQSRKSGWTGAGRRCQPERSGGSPALVRGQGISGLYPGLKGKGVDPSQAQDDRGSWAGYPKQARPWSDPERSEG